MTTTDASRAAGRLPDLRYQEAENDLRAAVRGLLDDRSPWPSVLARTETDEPNDAALWHSLAAELGADRAADVGPPGHLREEADCTWIERYFVTFGSTISAGTSEIQRNIIAERVLGLPRG